MLGEKYCMHYSQGRNFRKPEYSSQPVAVAKFYTWSWHCVMPFQWQDSIIAINSKIWKCFYDLNLNDKHTSVERFGLTLV